MPQQMGFTEAASVPVVACTAWQMVVEYGGIDATKRVLLHGAAGNVGAYALQLARRLRVKWSRPRWRRMSRMSRHSTRAGSLT